MNTKYPLCEKFGLEVFYDHTEYIPWDAIELMPGGLPAHILGCLDHQTCHVRGPYPWDVEKILRRLS